MAAGFEGVVLSSLSDTGEITQKFPLPLLLTVADESENLIVKFKKRDSNGPEGVHEVEVFKDTDTARVGKRAYVITHGKGTLLLQFPTCEGDSNGPEGVHEVEVFKDTDTARVGKRAYVITHGKGTLLLQFPTCEEVLRFHGIVDKFKSGHISSIFAQRTDEASATQYFQFYGYLSQQQNMMQDYIRTSTYQRAILNNMEDFKDKVIEATLALSSSRAGTIHEGY
ncbi:hypothetical protein IscW_ISCW003830 [Ixodes scapularis]|uniref:type I protein arginine methyltransferase n=1 Tax=Ixodes scapularis TaxID=6945 RepID=B7PJE9_IXOSC|nr:hypothetical protein IscW_ISCW003830 [Ixodes scapularis]|eukprot:XP_002407822.1 hypothetical protein IscW_ISCW003830 [Ixodes scapularis]